MTAHEHKMNALCLVGPAPAPANTTVFTLTLGRAATILVLPGTRRRRGGRTATIGVASTIDSPNQLPY
jgi:hypothetical protein